MKVVKVYVYLPKAQTSIDMIIPESYKSLVDQENFIADSLEKKYPDYYRWGVISWSIDWPKKDIKRSNYVDNS